ncbi:MAG TPA: hypothetical protein VIM61_05125 [Chthoniobacterales bacterium]|jgi:hypothetical protein
MIIFLAIAFVVANPFYSVGPDVREHSGNPWNVDICLFSEVVPAKVDYDVTETFLRTHAPGVSKTKDGTHEFRWTEIWRNRLREVIEKEVGKVDGRRVLSFNYSYQQGLFVVAYEQSPGFFRPFFISNEGEEYHGELVDEHTVLITTFLNGTRGYDTFDTYKFSNGTFAHSRKTSELGSAHP